MAGTPKNPGNGPGNIPPRPGGGRPAAKRPTGKPGAYGPRTGGARPAAQRASARQAIQKRRQRNLYVAGGSVGLVLVIVAVFVIAKLASGGSSTGPSTVKGVAAGTFALPASEVKAVTTISVKSMVNNALAAEAADKASPSDPPASAPQPIKGKPISSGGKPEVLYVGAEYCPYCAAERWSLVMALSRFGTFTGLRGTTSSASDVNPSTPTFSFYNATYKSPYLSFVTVEEETNTKAPLQDPTAAENALVTKWDVPPYTTEADSIPFVYFDGKYLVTGAQFDASKISEENFDDATPFMTSGATSTSKNAEAAAGFVVADLCAVTNNKPANVCSTVPASLKNFASGKANSGSSSAATTTTAKGAGSTTKPAATTTSTKAG